MGMASRIQGNKETPEGIKEEKITEEYKEALRNTYFPENYKERQAVFIDKKRPPVHTYNDSVYSPYRDNDDTENNDRDDWVDIQENT